MTFEILPSRTRLGWLKVPQHKSHSCFETMVITVKAATAEAGSSPKSCCIWGGWGEPSNKHQALYQAAPAHWKNDQASRSGSTQYTVTPDFLFFYCSSLYFNILIVKNNFFSSVFVLLNYLSSFIFSRTVLSVGIWHREPNLLTMWKLPWESERLFW